MVCAMLRTRAAVRRRLRLRLRRVPGPRRTRRRGEHAGRLARCGVIGGFDKGPRWDGALHARDAHAAVTAHLHLAHAVRGGDAVDALVEGRGGDQLSDAASRQAKVNPLMSMRSTVACSTVKDLIRSEGCLDSGWVCVRVVDFLFDSSS